MFTSIKLIIDQCLKFGSTKRIIDKTKNGKNVPNLVLVKAVLV